jgi:pimeloyl-ACP methyl ester carboxylesterase
MALAHRIRHFSTAHVALLSIAVLGAACSSRIPARVVTVDGRQVELATAGTGGGATVVFEAGLGEDWTHWDEVASEVARHTRVFAYSRPGFGASDPYTTPRDPRTIVQELRALLASQGYAPPYIVVGHSMGGGYMELFAKAHPDEVEGAVLVDSRPGDFLAVCEAMQFANCGISESLLATQAPAMVAEYHAYTTASEEIRAAGTFGSYPVRVLTATDHPDWTMEVDALWESMHRSLAAEAADGEQITVQGAGHHIQLDRPDVVVDNILGMLPSTSP